MGTNGETQGSSPGSKMIDLKECLQDSPHFRSQLFDSEQEINDLEIKLEKVVHSCDRMVSSGHGYTEACRGFSNSLRDLSVHFKDSGVVSETLKRFYEALSELQTYYSILFDQAQRSVQSALRAFLSGDLKKVKDMKKTFDKIRDELHGAINRNAHAPKSKPQEAEEASIQLANVQAQFSHHAIDYGYQINVIGCVKAHEILDNLLSYMRAQFTFFHQGYDLLKEFDPFMRQVASEVDQLRKDADTSVSSMDNRHSLVTPQHLYDGSPDEPLLPMDNPAVPIEMSGYLFKRGSGTFSGPFKSWSRRWFILRDNKIMYQSESKAEEFVTVAEDLRICTVKHVEDLDRRFCFEVVTPSRSCLMQADSEALRRMWVLHFEAGIARALRISASNKKKEEMQDFRRRTATVSSQRSPPPMRNDSPVSLRLRSNTALSVTSKYSLGLDFLDVPGNDRCADCGGKKPKWASINLGIMLCIECSGIHRSLGVHISKVRSVTLDDWEPEVQKIMCALGNARVNAIYEYQIPDHVKKPTSDTPRSDREAFIKAKYVQHAFVHPHPNFERPTIPPPPLRLPQLHSLGSTKSPRQQKRSFSPQLRIRTPKLKLSRPSSTSSGLDQIGTSRPSSASLIDSDDEFLKKMKEEGALGDKPSTMLLLAENLKKLEKSGKLKSWNFGSIGGNLSSLGGKMSIGGNLSTLSDRIKAKRGSFIGRFSKSSSTINRSSRKKSSQKVPSEERPLRSSDNEDDSDSLSSSTTSTPLLKSKSAARLTPPPKPPRTFKTRRLDLGLAVNECPVEDQLPRPLFPQESEDFSSDVFSAIKEMGTVYSQMEDEEWENRERSATTTLLPVPGEERECRQRSATTIGDAIIANGRIANGGIVMGIIAECHPEGSTGEHLEVPKAEGEELSEGSEDQLTENGETFEDALEISVEENQTATLERRGPQFEEEEGEEQDRVGPEGNAQPGDDTEQDKTSTLRRKEELQLPNLDEQGILIVTTPTTPLATRAERIISDSSTPTEAETPMQELGLEGGKDGDTIEIRGTPVILRNKREGINVPFHTQGSCELQVPSRFGSDEVRILFDDQRMSILSECGTEYYSASSSDSRPSTASTSPEIPELPELSIPVFAPTQNEVEDIPRSPSSASESFDTPPTSPPLCMAATHEPTNQVKEDDHVTAAEVASRETQSSQEPESVGSGADENSRMTTDQGETDSSQPQKRPQTELDSIFPAGEPPQPHQRSLSAGESPNQHSRRRSSGQLEKLEARDTVGTLYSNLSRDDNFDMEFHHKYFRRPSRGEGGLVSSFSAQDIVDIFGPSVPDVSVEDTTEVEEEGAYDSAIGSSEVDHRSGTTHTGSVEGLNDPDSLSMGEEVEGGMRVPSSLGSRTVSSENIAPVIIPDSITPDLYLYNCSLVADLPGILCAIAHGGNVNFVNEEDEGMCPILKAIATGSSVTTEYLFQNGVRLNCRDPKGQGCLHHAVMNEDASMVVLLLKRGAKPDLVDENGKDPVALALERENGDLVTLLRVAQLRTDNRHDRHSQVLEDTVAEVYRDFQVAALIEPERMKKRRSRASPDAVSLESRESK